MVKLNPYVDQGSVETGISAFRPIAAEDDTARAMQRFGSQLGGLALDIAKRDRTLDIKDKQEMERLDSIRAQRTLLDLRELTTERLREGVANMDPADPHFYDKFRAETHKVYTEAFSKLALTGPLADKVELQFQQQAVNFNGMAAQQASAARQKYVQDTLTKAGDTYAKAILSGTMDRVGALAEVGNVIDSMGLPPEAAAVSKRHIYSLIDGAAATRYVEQNGTRAHRELRDQLSERFKIGTEAANPAHRSMLDAAERHGLPNWMLPFIASRENPKLDPMLKNPKSSAFGYFQFIDGDWKETGIPKTANPELQIEAAAIRMRKMIGFMETNRIPVTPGTLYGSHLMGRAGFARMYEYLTANPNADAETVYASVAGAKIAQQAFSGSNGKLLVRGSTVAQTIEAIEKYARDGMAKTQAMLGGEKEMPDMAAPVTLGGVPLENLTRRDAHAIFIKSLDQARREADAAVKAAEKAQAHNFQLNGYDQDSRRIANEQHRNMQLGEKILQGNPDALGYAMQHAQQTGFVSRNISSAAELLMEGPDAGKKMSAYELGRLVHNSDPTGGLTNSAFDPAARRKLELYTSIVNLRGNQATPEDMQNAIARAERVYQREKDFEKLPESAKDRFKEEVGRRSFRELSSDLEWTGGRPWWGYIPAVSTVVAGSMFRQNDTAPQTTAQQGMLERLYQSAFARHYREMNQSDPDAVEAAKVLAQTEVKRTLGVSQVMGNVNRTMYPPEAVLPKVGGNHEWIKRQVMDAVAIDVSSRNRGAKVPAGPTKPENVWIVGDSTTGHEVNSGRVPTYTILYQDDKGVLQRIEQRWKPNVEALVGQRTPEEPGRPTTPAAPPADDKARDTLRKARETGPPAKRTETLGRQMLDSVVRAAPYAMPGPGAVERGRLLDGFRRREKK